MPAILNMITLSCHLSWAVIVVANNCSERSATHARNTNGHQFIANLEYTPGAVREEKTQSTECKKRVDDILKHTMGKNANAGRITSIARNSIPEK
jgi:hypothetical protein